MKTLLLIVGLTAALSTGLPDDGDPEKICHRLVNNGRGWAAKISNDTLANDVRAILARAEKLCWAGEYQSGIDTAKSVVALLR